MLLSTGGKISLLVSIFIQIKYLSYFIASFEKPKYTLRRNKYRIYNGKSLYIFLNNILFSFFVKLSLYRHLFIKIILFKVLLYYYLTNTLDVKKVMKLKTIVLTNYVALFCIRLTDIFRYKLKVMHKPFYTRGLTNTVLKGSTLPAHKEVFSLYFTRLEELFFLLASYLYSSYSIRRSLNVFYSYLYHLTLLSRSSFLLLLKLCIVAKSIFCIDSLVGYILTYVFNYCYYYYLLFFYSYIRWFYNYSYIMLCFYIILVIKYFYTSFSIIYKYLVGINGLFYFNAKKVLFTFLLTTFNKTLHLLIKSSTTSYSSLVKRQKRPFYISTLIVNKRRTARAIRLSTSNVKGRSQSRRIKALAKKARKLGRGYLFHKRLTFYRIKGYISIPYYDYVIYLYCMFYNIRLKRSFLNFYYKSLYIFFFSLQSIALGKFIISSTVELFIFLSSLYVIIYILFFKVRRLFKVVYIIKLNNFFMNILDYKGFCIYNISSGLILRESLRLHKAKANITSRRLRPKTAFIIKAVSTFLLSQFINDSFNSMYKYKYYILCIKFYGRRPRSSLLYKSIYKIWDRAKVYKESNTDIEGPSFIRLRPIKFTNFIGIPYGFGVTPKYRYRRRRKKRLKFMR